MTKFPGVLFLLLVMGVAGCSSPQRSQPPPSTPSVPSSSSPIPSSSPPSTPGTPSGSPSTPSSPSSSPPSSSQGSQGQSGQSMPSGGIPGSPGSPGGTSGEQTAGNEQGDSDQNQNSSEEGSENGEDPGNDGWDTSNQIPGGEEENQTAGGGDGESAGDPQGSPGEDGELNGAFEDFDGTILEERELILAKANENAGSRDREAEEPLPEIPGAANGSDSGNSGQSPGGNVPLPPRSGAPSSNTGVANIPAGDLPKDLPDARDDDILARQLREAAMSEPDPELREKLWNEYRRYKNGL